MASKLTEYKFQLNGFMSEAYRVYPNDKFTIEWERFEDEVFYRKQISTLNFANIERLGIDDFDLFWNHENSPNRCAAIPLTVYATCNDIDTELLSGKFYMVDGKWDISKCKLEIDVRPSDRYSCVVDNWDSPINVFEFVAESDKVKLETSPDSVLEQVTCEEDNNDPTFINIISNRKLPYGACISGAGWAVLKHYSEITNHFIFGTRMNRKTTWVRERYTGAGVPSSGDWIEEDGNYYRSPKMFKVEETELNAESYYIPNPYELINVLISESYDNGIKLEDFIKILVNQTCNAYEIRSEFFGINAAQSPLNDAYQYAIDYFEEIVVFQKTDVKYNSADQNATSFGNDNAALTLHKFLNDLKKWANVYWDITDDGTLIIEHISYFINQGDWDLTQAPMRKFIEGKAAYTYKKNDLPKQEKFQYMEDVTQEFRGLPIVYNNDCNSEDIDESIYKCEFTNNDFTMVARPDEVSDDGIIFITAKNNYTEMREDWIPVMNRTEYNGALSFYNLIPSLMLYERPQINGLVNGNDTTFYSQLPPRAHDPLTVHLCCEQILQMTPKMKRTQFGWARVSKISLEEPKGEVTFNLDF